MDQFLRETGLLDFSHAAIERIVRERGWRGLEPFERIRAIYNFVRDEILFGYNVDDHIPASKVLSDGYGQCNTKGILFSTMHATEATEFSRGPHSRNIGNLSTTASPYAPGRHCMRRLSDSSIPSPDFRWISTPPFLPI